MTTRAPASTTKRCSTCRLEQPRDQFHREARRKDGRDPRCRPCRAVARLQGPAGPTPPVPGDPEPAIRLRHELVAARRSGQSFDDAWPPAVQTALEISAQREIESWETALASTKGAWSSAYCREVALAGHGALSTLAEAA